MKGNPWIALSTTITAQRRRRVAALALVIACAQLGGAAASATGGAATPPAPAGVARVLDEVFGKPMYEHSTWGYEVADANTGELLLGRNVGSMFLTGSTLKLYSSAAALAVLGGQHRFRTPVYRRGPVRGGVLRGDLVLVASGDFSFGLRDRRNGTLAFNNAPQIDHNYGDTGLPGPALVPHSHPLAGVEDLARQVRASGIRRVMGNVVIDDRLFRTFDGWPDGLISPMWINENVIDITAAPSSPGRLARIAWRPRTSAVRVVSTVRTVTGPGRSVTVESPAPGVVRISGRISAASKPILSIWQIPDPAAFARTVFIEALRRAGVQVSAPAAGANPAALLRSRTSYRRAERVALHVSPPLSQFVKVILKVSYNRGADDMVCLVAAAEGSRDCLAGLKTEQRTIVRLGVSPVTTVLFDGAGSSDFDRSSLTDFTTFLRRVQSTPWGRTLRDGLAILGVDGLLATSERGTPAAGHVFAKDGTRANVSPADGRGILAGLSQAGYIDAHSGRRLVYAEFLRDLPLASDFGGFYAARDDQGRIAAAFQEGW
jgi:D-alanyl-D-alanine carboxypeptidase/D-alanyl-D-alanine-endopeptidase (penicillin-binding protein 4)